MKLGKITTSCKDLILDAFIDCVLNSNYKRLIIKGFATKKQLEYAWNMIYAEYSVLIGSKETNRILEIYKTIGQLQAKALAIRISLVILTTKKDPKSIEIINNYGYRIRPEYLFDDIQKVSNQIKSMDFQIKVLDLELKDLLKKEQKQVTQKDFDEILSAMWKFQGSRVDAKQITVSEFCAIHQRMVKENEANQRAYENLKTK